MIKPFIIYRPQRRAFGCPYGVAEVVKATPKTLSLTRSSIHDRQTSPDNVVAAFDTLDEAKALERRLQSAWAHAEDVRRRSYDNFDRQAERLIAEALGTLESPSTATMTVTLRPGAPEALPV